MRIALGTLLLIGLQSVMPGSSVSGRTTEHSRVTTAAVVESPAQKPARRRAAAGGSEDAPDRRPMVEVTGCLATAPRDGWRLVKATEPARLEGASTGRASADAPLGRRTYDLMGVALFAPARYTGHKVRVQGLLVDERINVTSLVTVSETCS